MGKYNNPTTKVRLKPASELQLGERVEVITKTGGSVAYSWEKVKNIVPTSDRVGWMFMLETRSVYYQPTATIRYRCAVKEGIEA